MRQHECHRPREPLLADRAQLDRRAGPLGDCRGITLVMLGFGFDEISREDRAAVLAAYPRIDFKESIIQAFADGFAHKPDTTFGTMNADVLAETLPGYERPNFCAIIRGSKHGT